MLNLIVDCEQVEIMVVLKILEQITATPPELLSNYT